MDQENLKFNLDTQLVLNIGYPINKTNAPIVYNKLFKLHGMNMLMLPAEIKKGELENLFFACRTLGIRYLCPTMPHKTDIVNYLDIVDESSRIFQSVNAIKFDENGHSHGVGMDGKGAVLALLESGCRLEGATALVLGTGGISGVIGYELSQYGVKKLFIVGTTKEKAEKKANILNQHTPMVTVPFESSPEVLDQVALETDIFIQATPLGMIDYGYNHKYLGFIERFPPNCTVLDAVVNPPETEVIKAAKSRKLKTVPGLQMLVGQIALIFDFMFNVKITEKDKEICIQELTDILISQKP